MMTITGGCLCGQVRYTTSASPAFQVACHCTNCKRRTGSAFGISAYFLRSNVAETTGELLVYAFHHAAENHDQERYFCKRCGTTLFWYTSARPHLIGIAGGCFPDESLAEPTISFTSSKKLAWVGLPSSWKFLER